MNAVKIKDLKKGQMFVLKEVFEPSSKQVWIRNHYDRSSKTYAAYYFDDVCYERFFKPDRLVYVDFIF